MTSRSFRWRLLIGALIAGFGLFTLSPLIALMVLQANKLTLHFVHIVAMAVTGTACIAAGAWQIRRGLSPFHVLRDRLADVREGRTTRLEGKYPSEVQPLANELNAFLEDRERIVRRAVTKAGDLAHGLKTPLAILSREAERAAANGQTELAAVMLQQVERMHRSVEYHLAYARAVGSGTKSGARTSVLASAEGLTRALQRLHADRNLQLDIEVSSHHHVRVEREDLDEMLGNLLDNACKWARSRVVIASSLDGDARLSITVDDDGRGIDPSMRDAVLQRGVRADEAAPGSGLGLAIVRELVELYGGTIALDHSPLGGLRVLLSLPN